MTFQDVVFFLAFFTTTVFVGSFVSGALNLALNARRSAQRFDLPQSE